MKKLLLTILISLLALPAYADNPRLPYDLQKKHRKMLCVFLGIPLQQCHRPVKKPKS